MIDNRIVTERTVDTMPRIYAGSSQANSTDRYYYRELLLPRFPYPHRIPKAVERAFLQGQSALNKSQRLFRYNRRYRDMNARLGIRRVHTPFNDEFICYKGSAWWTLSRRAIDYIRDFFEERPNVVDFYRRRRAWVTGAYASWLISRVALQRCSQMVEILRQFRHLLPALGCKPS